MGALALRPLQILHQQRDARVLHDQHVGLLIDQRRQGLLHRRRVVIGIAHLVFHAAPFGLFLHHAAPFVGQGHAERDRQVGDGLALQRLVVVGAQFARGLGAAFFLRRGH